jgi:hypothetical protein
MFFGKNKVMMVALGRSPSDEYKDNLHQVNDWSLLGGAKVKLPALQFPCATPAPLMARMEVKKSPS